MEKYSSPHNVVVDCDRKCVMKAINNHVSEVVIPEGVEVIGERAFAECTELVSVIMPDSVVIIGDSAFRYCIKLSTIRFSRNLRTIERLAFAYTFSLVSINLPNSLREIKDAAFHGTSLGTVNIPDGVEIIGKDVFLNSGIHSVKIPKTLKEVGKNIFGICPLDELHINIEDLDQFSFPPTTIHINASPILYVPIGKMDIYKNDSFFCTFQHIEEWNNKGLNRFVEAQFEQYDIAYSEVLKGQKLSHWIWYIFPQLKGLGRSYYSDYYGITDIEEARAYLIHAILGERLRKISQALLSVKDKTAMEIFGHDARKVKSCMTLFDYVSPDDIFSDVLDTFFEGKRSFRTLKMIEAVPLKEE